MALIVQKYGGTSVGTPERIQAVAERIVQTSQEGHQVVVVVSAMGKTTDSLVALSKAVTDTPPRREMDMLLSTGEQVSIALVSMAIQSLGQPAVSLTGGQVGILTEAEHGRARILHIDPNRLMHHIKAGRVVVVAGFQGVSSSRDLEITTLGRGGSDTSAVALAAALGADLCEIYTDVPGILTTDPRLVPEARVLNAITCEEMLELASLGAKVLHPRAVEIARNFGVPLVVRSSWTDEPGTEVRSPGPRTIPRQDIEMSRLVDGVEVDDQQVKVALRHVADRPGVAAHLFRALAKANINVDLIIQSIHAGNTNDIAFTVHRRDLARVTPLAHQVATELGGAEVDIDPQVAKVSIVGAGMIGRPGVASTMFSALGDAGINIQLISTSEIKVSCIIIAPDAPRAVGVLCQSFGVSCVASTPGETDGAPVRGVALDPRQAQMAILQVPDRPGAAGRLFLALAQARISVDMIIQSQRTTVTAGRVTRDIAFTLHEEDVPAAQQALEPVLQTLDCGPVVVNPSIAKVSIVGTGMVEKPGVAAQLFEALAAADINIQMIATSEIKVSCLVGADRGVAALQHIHQAFALE
ncbi:MAG: aspartate kinase [Gloeomargaritaceae cyanobacterium C42_A2020_066]|nr:aspartate kinase [Gloeomargaritaceae cyanobacterium C42_A2020_066]